MKIRRTKVTVVTEHVFTFAEYRSPIQVECETCGAPTRMISLNEASSVSGISPEAIRQQVEASGLHFTAREDGALFICLAHSKSIESSLVRKVRKVGDTDTQQ